MKELIEKFRDIERMLSQEIGEFSLFALFLREDSIDKWDLIVASDWIDGHRKEALSLITDRIKNNLTAHELSKLSRVVLVEMSNPAIAAISHDVSISHGLFEIQNSNFFGLGI